MTLSAEMIALLGLGVTLVALIWNASRKVEAMANDIIHLTTSVDRLGDLPERVAALEAKICRSSVRQRK